VAAGEEAVIHAEPVVARRSQRRPLVVGWPVVVLLLLLLLVLVLVLVLVAAVDVLLLLVASVAVGPCRGPHKTQFLRRLLQRNTSTSVLVSDHPSPKAYKNLFLPSS
jgi:hypothetical protein